MEKERADQDYYNKAEGGKDKKSSLNLSSIEGGRNHNIY